MSKNVMIAVIGIGLLFGCDEVQPGEEKVTIVMYDPSYHICGGSWIIQGKGKQLRTLELPTAYQQKDTPVWIRYAPDTLRSSASYANCNFVKLITIRKRE